MNDLPNVHPEPAVQPLEELRVDVSQPVGEPHVEVLHTVADAAPAPAPAGRNCGKKATKNSGGLGLRRFSRGRAG